MNKFIYIINILYFYLGVLLSFNKFEVLHVILYQRITELKSRKNSQTLQVSLSAKRISFFYNIINIWLSSSAYILPLKGKPHYSFDNTCPQVLLLRTWNVFPGILSPLALVSYQEAWRINLHYANLKTVGILHLPTLSRH